MRTWTGTSCVLGIPQEMWDTETAFGVRDIKKAGQCHCETSVKHLGKARAIREVREDLKKAGVK